MKRILIISHKSPYTSVDGGVIAIRNFFEGLNKHPEFKVTMFCIETQKHKHNQSENKYKETCIPHYIDTRIKPLEAVKQLLKKQSYNLSRFYDSELSQKIINHLQSNTYDYILFESLFSTIYYHDLKSHFKGKFLYRSHNIEYNIWNKLSIHEKNPVKKWYLKQLTATLKQYELNIQDKMDAIFSISKEDLNFYKSSTSVPSYLLFFIRKPKSRINPIKPKSFFHLASMDWKPNLEAVQWFVEEVWKPVYKNDNSLTLYLAGKYMPEHYFNMANFGIKACDYVEDGDTFMQEHGTLVVPLFTGSGIRIKVADALCMNVPIISTNLGVSGIGIQNEIHYLEANSADDFRKHIQSIVKKDVDLDKMVKKSKIFANENFEEFAVLDQFSNQLNQI